MKSDYEHAILMGYQSFRNFTTTLAKLQSNITNRSLKQNAPLWLNQQHGIANLLNSLTLNYQTDDKEKEESNKSVEVVAVKKKEVYKCEAKDEKAMQLTDEKMDEEKQQPVKLANEQVIVDQGDAWQQQSSEQSSENAQDLSFIHDNKSSAQFRSYKRGPYKRYTLQQKQRAVALMREGQHTITQISKHLSIPCKNIKRWTTQGVFRKRGGGRRRSNPSMENKVFSWLRGTYRMGETVEIGEIQNKALEVGEDGVFKASRGWALKFVERYQLRKYYTLK